MNKVTWFTKQLQYKTNREALELSPADDGFTLAMDSLFAMDCFDSDSPEKCEVSKDEKVSGQNGNKYFAKIIQGKHYRLKVNEQEALFKIMTRKIWFFVDVDSMIADLAVDVWAKENKN